MSHKTYITEIKTPILGDNLIGKFWCVAYKEGDATIARYLNKEGFWQRHTDYFDTKAEVEELLKLGRKPDFSLNAVERYTEDWVTNDIRSDMDDDRYAS